MPVEQPDQEPGSETPRADDNREIGTGWNLPEYTFSGVRAAAEDVLKVSGTDPASSGGAEKATKTSGDPLETADGRATR